MIAIEVAHDDRPIGHRHRADKGEQDASHDGEAVADGAVQLHELAVAPFKEHARRHGHQHDRQRPEAEEIDRRDQRRQQRDAHIPHDAGRGLAGPDMGRGGDREIFQFQHTFTSSGICGFCLGIPQLLLAGAEALDEMDLGRARVRAGAALDAIQQVHPFQALQIIRLLVPV